MASVALGDLDRHFAWQAWHLWHWAGFGGAPGFPNDAVGAAAFGVAGVALGDMDLHFAWQAWHLATWIVTLRGRRGIYGTGLALVARLVPVGAAALCVAGVALGDTHLRFAWQASHPLTSTFTLRGRGSTYGDSHLRFAWEAFAVPHVGYVGYMLTSSFLVV